MATKYDLSWKEVYEIDSEFQSLRRAEAIKKESIEKMIQKLKFTHTQAAKVEQKKLEGELDTLVQRRYGAMSDEAGITFRTFMEYEKLFNGKTDIVKNAIIQAFGIDVSNEHAMVFQD